MTHEAESLEPEYNQSRLNAFLRVINNPQNLSLEARKATGFRGRKLFQFIIDQRDALIDEHYPESSPVRTMELGRSALILTSAEGENWLDLQAKALAFGMDPYKDIKGWLRDGVRDGARYYGTQFAQAPHTEPKVVSADEQLDIVVPHKDVTAVYPVEYADLQNTIVDLVEDKKIKSPVLAGGMIVLFELQKPARNKSKEKINDTLFVTVQLLTDHLMKLKGSNEVDVSVRMLRHLLSNPDSITADSKLVTQYVDGIKTAFDSLEDARQYAESHIAHALEITFNS